MRDTIRDLKIAQPVRRVTDPPTFERIDGMLVKMRDFIGIDEGEEDDDGGVGDDDDEERPKRSAADEDKPGVEKPFVPFSIVLEDPSGNSFIQFIGSTSDAQWNMRAFNRTVEQNVTLGLVAAPEGAEQQNAGGPLLDDAHKLASIEEFEARKRKDFEAIAREGLPVGVVPDEVYSFPSTCSSCGHPLETLMQQVNIPYFQVCFQKTPASYADATRTLSSCRRIATPVATEITRSNPVVLSLIRAPKLLSKWRTKRICPVTCSSQTLRV